MKEVAYHPYGTTVFCDDIRHEIGNKLTLVGCYTGVITFPNKAPSTLPTLGALTTIAVPLSFEMRHLVFSVEMFDGKKANTILQIEQDFTSLPELKQIPEDATMKQFNIPAQWSPLHFVGNGWISAKCKLNNELEFITGRVWVRFQNENPEAENTTNSHQAE